MRSHGDPSQTDPTIDANKVIHVVMPLSVPGGLYGSNGQSSSGPGSYCGKYLTAASTALRGGQQAPTPPSQAELVKYADCMRANGISNFPDPIAGGFNLRALNPNSPAVQNAAKVCATKTGVRPVGGGGPLPPGTIVSGPPGEAGMPFVPLSGSSS